MSACFREEKQREREEQALKERENISNREDPQAADEDEETKAAVVLQSNYRGFKERKKLKERKKSIPGEEPQLGGRREMTNDQDERQEDMEEEEESTYKAEEGDDSDHTQVPEDEELVEMDGDVLEGGFISLEEETRAATVLQSNFRGHKERKRLQEEGKIPARQVQEGTGDTCSQVVDVAAVEVLLEEQEEAKAAVVLQSNFRGHKERKRLQEEGKIPEKKKKTEEERRERELPQEDDGQPGLDEEKAATVLQSNFRGHRERQKLREEREMKEKAREVEEEEEEEVVEEDTLDLTHVVVERRDEADAERERLEEEQAAVKIQSNFRGYKDRKNLKDAAQLQAEQLENFSRQVGPTPSADF